MPMQPLTWIRYSLTITIAAFALSNCASTDNPNVVTGRLMGARIGATDSALFTTPYQGQGVAITSSAGGGRRPVILSHIEVTRLIGHMETKLDQWSHYRSLPPFEETIMMGLVGTTGPQPFTVILARTPQMNHPVFVVTVAYQDTKASIALDRKNAQKWIGQLRSASNGY